MRSKTKFSQVRVKLVYAYCYVLHRERSQEIHRPQLYNCVNVSEDTGKVYIPFRLPFHHRKLTSYRSTPKCYRLSLTFWWRAFGIISSGNKLEWLYINIVWGPLKNLTLLARREFLTSVFWPCDYILAIANTILTPQYIWKVQIADLPFIFVCSWPYIILFIFFTAKCFFISLIICT